MEESAESADRSKHFGAAGAAEVSFNTVEKSGCQIDIHTGCFVKFAFCHDKNPYDKNCFKLQIPEFLGAAVGHTFGEIKGDFFGHLTAFDQIAQNIGHDPAEHFKA